MALGVKTTSSILMEEIPINHHRDMLLRACCAIPKFIFEGLPAVGQQMSLWCDLRGNDPRKTTYNPTPIDVLLRACCATVETILDRNQQ